MHRFLASGALAAALTALLWRLASGVAHEWMLLSGSGELEQRIERRRVRRLALVAVEAGIPPSPDPLHRPGVHRAVHAGAVRPGDVDDMGLLEAAMRSAVRARRDAAAEAAEAKQSVTPTVSVPDELQPVPVVPRTRGPRREVSRGDDPLRLIRDAATRVDAEQRERAPLWVVGAASIGVLATFVPLIRPLGSSSPWWALAGLAIIAVAAIGAHRSR